MGLQLRVRGGGARGGLEMTGGMDGRLIVVRWWRRRRDDEEKKRKRPRSHGSVSGAPVSVCVCVCVPLRCCVDGASVCEGERTRDSLFIFFLHFSFLSIAAATITAPLRHPTTTTTRNTCSLFFHPTQCTKGTPPPRRKPWGRKIFSR
ncbi:unnamed protein product [Aphis gossypii]|uniref:Uncharacterized protein n=1 Tax=Aphis gossypii TaxID=80765 RepID=A0A9P0NP28_APHGO|nr:unnamed protein product [Aphis gossypii]